MPAPRGNWKVRECAERVAPLLAAENGPAHADERDTNLSDVLANLIHFAYRHHLDFEAALSSARNHAEVEQAPHFNEGKQ